MWKYIVAILVLTSGGLYAAIVKTDQDQAKRMVKERAQVSFIQQDWPNSESTYRKVLEEEPTNSEAWFRVALAVHYQGRYEESIEAFRQAQANGYKPALCLYNIACGYARLGRTQPALQYLESALKQGLFGAKQIRSDADLKSLHGDAYFERLVDELGSDKDQKVIIIETHDSPTKK